MASNCGDYRNGFGPGIDNATGLVADPNKGANRYALTLGLDYAMTPNAMLKFEVRHDRATQNTFFDVGSSTFKKRQYIVRRFYRSQLLIRWMGQSLTVGPD
ncbi:hypothetical protein ACFS07_31430 [Undibacterium arcticum]